MYRIETLMSSKKSFPHAEKQLSSHNHPFELFDEDEEHARMICKSGNYARALAELKSEGLFERQKNRILTKYRKSIESVPSLTDELLEMAVVLELYDTETWEHSIRVYETAKEKVENKRKIGHYLREKLNEEGTPIQDLLLACLFHDIGKTHIPKEVLKSVITDEEWAMLAFAAFTPSEFSLALDRIQSIPRLRWKDIVPFSFSITPDRTEYLKAYGIDPTLPLGFIVGRHPDISAEILRSYGLNTAAEIARSHHNRPLAQEEQPVTLSSFRASWIIRAADISDAVRNARPYKKSNSLLKTLSVLARESEDGFIDTELARHWIQDDLFRSRIELERFLSDSRDEKNARFLARFLDKKSD